MSERAEKVLKYFEAEKEYTRRRVESGIELYRKGDVDIIVRDADGNPVSGAKIDAVETKQSFKFGANTFMVDELETEWKNRTYKKQFAELFNLGTVPFYWRDLEPEEGKPRFAADSPKIYRRPATDLCVEWLESEGLEPKLHCLNYDQFKPDWVKNVPTQVLKEKLSKRFREIAERYAKRIPMIEVTNETFCRQQPYAASDFFLSDEFVPWSFREARRYFTGNKLIINEAGIEWDSPNAHTGRNPYYMQVKELLAENVPVHGIGMQFHSFVPQAREIETFCKYDSRYNPEYLCAVMDRMNMLNLPLQITEMTIPAYSAGEEDEAIQAEILKNVYSLFFAQKGMEAIIYWNLPDGYAHRADPGDMTCGENIFYGGLVRFDFSEKPAYQTLKKLIREEWMTKAQLVTGDCGNAVLHGFGGEYDVTVSWNGKTVRKKLILKEGKRNAAEICMK